MNRKKREEVFNKMLNTLGDVQKELCDIIVSNPTIYTKEQLNVVIDTLYEAMSDITTFITTEEPDFKLRQDLRAAFKLIMRDTKKIEQIMQKNYGDYERE